MLSVSPALLAAARSPSARPFISLAVSDRDAGAVRLRLQHWSQGDEPDGPAAVAAPDDGSLLRARIDPSDSTLYVQRVAAPSPQADFTTWSAIGSAHPPAGLALAAAGARAILVFAAAGDVGYVHSTDSGATWTAPAQLADPAGPITAVAAATDSDGRAMVAWAVAGQLWAITRTHAAAAWSSPAQWSHSDALDSITGLVASREPDWAIQLSGVDPHGHAGAWTTNLGAGISMPPGQWSALEPVILAAPGTDVTYRASGIFHASVPRLLLSEAYAGGGAFAQPMIATAIDGALYTDGNWRDVLPLGLPDAPYGVHATTRGDSAYLTTAHSLWHTTTAAPTQEVAHHLLRLRYYTESLPGGFGIPRERLRFTLATEGDEGDEGDTVSDALVPGAEVRFRAGYYTTDGPEAPGSRALWVSSVRREPGHVHVEAEGPLAVMHRWRASRQITWAPGEQSVLQIAQAITRLAGFGIATTNPSTVAQTQQPPYTLRAGDHGDAALRRLLARTPDLLYNRGLQVVMLEAHPQDSAAATFALHPLAEQHPIRAAGLIQDRERIGWARVLGDGSAAQAVDLQALDLGGGIALAVDEHLDDPVETADRAAAEVRRAALAAQHAWIEVPPHPAIEPTDVIEVDRWALGVGATYRVVSVDLEYATRPRARYDMRLGLGAL
ncbi:MAG: hypothetical protein M0R73_13890 [Dehalococcoidia bacterium]|nr:hypothetical protein [Dehalococcoidia bacterium]